MSWPPFGHTSGNPSFGDAARGLEMPEQRPCRFQGSNIPERVRYFVVLRNG